ncbi:oxidative stress defense protein [compost metagenome]
MANADLKASAIAKASKRQLGIVLSVTQSNNEYSPYMNVSFSMAEAAMDKATSIEPGEITVKTTLAVVYELK